MDAAGHFFAQLWDLEVLPVAAAVESTTSVESAGAVSETSTTMETTTTVEVSPIAVESAAVKTALKATTSPESTVAIEIPPIEAPPVIPASIIATTVEAASVVAVEPRPGANEDAAHKVVRAVVAVRRTSVWVVPVVAVGAHRSRTIIGRADSNADNNALRVGRSRQRKYANS